MVFIAAVVLIAGTFLGSQERVISRARSATLVGVEARVVEVEVELTQGLPYFAIIGLGDTAVQEAKYRIQAALRACGIDLPHKRVTINLAPAALRKDGAALDLPMTLGLLSALELVPQQALDECLAVGEVSLSGDLRPVRGVLPVATLARSVQANRLFVPYENGGEARAIAPLEVIAVRSLGEVLEILRGERKSDLAEDSSAARADEAPRVDMREIRGQRLARRVLEIAAAGGHNVLFVGNPGAGKTMLARRIPTILPPLLVEEQIEVTAIWSAAGHTVGRPGLIRERPFRAPHHSISAAGLIGGGASIRPGEVSLAHRGVLFLDEMPELPRHVLESLRQPIEDRQVIISRAKESATFPARFMLVGAANPCPCGWLGHPSGRCTCSGESVRRYASRISGALLDRIDLVVTMPSPTADELLGEADSEDSAAIRSRVVEARSVAYDRALRPNSELSGRELRLLARISDEARSLLRSALAELEISARSMERTVRVARTIADLKGDPRVSREAMAEALQYRARTWGSC